MYAPEMHCDFDEAPATAVAVPESQAMQVATLVARLVSLNVESGQGVHDALRSRFANVPDTHSEQTAAPATEN